MTGSRLIVNDIWLSGCPRTPVERRGQESATNESMGLLNAARQQPRDVTAFPCKMNSLTPVRHFSSLAPPAYAASTQQGTFGLNCVAEGLGWHVAGDGQTLSRRPRGSSTVHRTQRLRRQACLTFLFNPS